MSSLANLLRFGTIVLVPFPFTDQSGSKQRPAVIVSSDVYHRSRRDLIIMPITSQAGSAGLGDVTVQDWKNARLLKPSAVKPVLATMERSLVIRTLGNLASRDAAAVRQSLATILG